MPAPEPFRDNGRPCLPLFLGLAVILCLDAVLGPYSLIHFHDSFDMEIPHFLVQGDILRRFGLTGWYPAYCGGLPSFVSHRTPYHLYSVLSSALPLWAVYWGARIVLLAAAGCGMCRLLERTFAVGRPVALLAGAWFMLSVQIFEIYYPFYFLFPLVFLWTQELADGGLTLAGRLWRALAFLALSLASYPVLTVPYLPALHLFLVLAFAREPGRTGRRVAAVFALWTGYVLIFVPYFYSLLDYIPLMQRKYEQHFTGLGPALAFVGRNTLAALHGDQLTFGLFLFGLPRALASRRMALLLALALAPAILSALFLSPFKALLAGTFLVKMDLGNVMHLLQFVVPLFGFVALDEHRRRPWRHDWILATLAAVGAALPVAANVAIPRILCLAFGYGLLTLHRGQVLAAPRVRALALAALALCLALSVCLKRQELLLGTTHVPYLKGFGGVPELAALARDSAGRPMRVASVDLHPFVAGFYGFETVGQKGVLFNAAYKRYVRSVVKPQFREPGTEAAFDGHIYQLFLTGLDIHKDYFLAFNPGRPRHASEWNLPMLAAMNVEYLLSSKPIEGIEDFAEPAGRFPGPGLPLAPEGSRADLSLRLPLWLYRVKNPQPRAFLALPQVLPGSEEVLGAMEAAGQPALGRTAYLSAQELGTRPEWGATLAQMATEVPQAAPRPLGESRITAYSPDTLTVEGRAESPCLLLVSNNFDPHWTATVNGRPAPILRANEAFQALPLEAGPFTVRLAYANPLLWRLHWISVAGVLLVLGVSLRGRKPEARPAACLDLGEEEIEGSASPASAGPVAWTVLGVVLVWAAAFALTTARKHAASDLPVAYVAWTGAALGLPLSLWTRALLTRLAPGPGAAPGISPER